MTVFAPIKSKARFVHVQVSDDGKTLTLTPHRLRVANSVFNEEFLTVDKGHHAQDKVFTCSMKNKQSKAVVQFVLPRQDLRTYYDGYSAWESLERYVTQQAPEKLKTWATRLKEYEVEVEPSYVA